MADDLTRRAFLKLLRRGAGGAAATAVGGPLLKALGGGLGGEIGGVLDDEIPGLKPLEEQIMDMLSQARGDPVMRDRVIKQGLKMLGLSAKESIPFTDVDLPEHGPQGVLEEYLEAETLRDALADYYHINDAPEGESFHFNKGYDELARDTHDLANFDYTISSYGGNQGYADHLRDLVAETEERIASGKLKREDASAMHDTLLDNLGPVAGRIEKEFPALPSAFDPPLQGELPDAREGNFGDLLGTAANVFPITRGLKIGKKVIDTLGKKTLEATGKATKAPPLQITDQRQVPFKVDPVKQKSEILR